MTNALIGKFILGLSVSLFCVGFLQGFAGETDLLVGLQWLLTLPQIVFIIWGAFRLIKSDEA